MPFLRAKKAADDAGQDMTESLSELSMEEHDDSAIEVVSDERPIGKGRGQKRKSGGESAISKQGKSGGMGCSAHVPVEEEMGGSLFEIVKAGKASLQVVVEDWIENYKVNKDGSLMELMQFFIQCSGCKGIITLDMFSNMEHAKIIRQMTEEFDKDSTDYPLVKTGPQWKKFKANFSEFVQTLVRQCQNSILYDECLMDNTISLLTGLSDSQVRAFRHTSTLAAMKLMTALVDVSVNLNTNVDNTQRQFDVEKQKTKNKQGTERLKVLLSKKEELEANQEEIRNMLTYLFKGVFVHRYRDILAEIRVICMQEIGVWMKKYPGVFLDDSYLKYIGWTLYDKVGDVRHSCLQALCILYNAASDTCTKLEYFTGRFKDRILDMMLDKETDVSVEAVKLVTCIFNSFGDAVLSDKDCERVYEMVFSCHQQVAQAAGEFLNAKLFQQDEEACPQKTAAGKQQSPNTPLIRDLVQFFIESELMEYGAYLVDSLWNVNPMMKDWECMTGLLLDEPRPGEVDLDDRQEAGLIDLMVCCVKQAATGTSPTGRESIKPKLTTKEKHWMDKDKTRLTEHFIVALPRLLSKYLMDIEKVTNLLHIPQYFNLDIYKSSRQEKNLDGLLRYLREIVEKHANEEVLETTSKCFYCLCDESYTIYSKCDVARSTLIDSLVMKFKEAMQDFFTKGELPDEDEVYALTAALKRLYAFSCFHNLTSWDLWVDMFQIVKLASENVELADDIVCKAQGTILMMLLWTVKCLDNSSDQEHILEIKKHQEDLMKYCHLLLYHTSNKICEDVYLTLCDLLIVFSKPLQQKKSLGLLVYKPDKSLQNQLTSFLMDKVFIDDDNGIVDENTKVEILHKRRNLLTCFCKLIIYNIVNIKALACIFKHYMKFYHEYVDIMKVTLHKSKEINNVATAKALMTSLTQLYRELLDEHGGNIEKSSEAFLSIKELARRFSLSFGLGGQMKNREAVAVMHKEGILFSLSHADPDDPSKALSNLSFLEILCEFSNKLLKQDKKTVLNYLNNELTGLLPNHGDSEDWQALMTYRNSLGYGELGLRQVAFTEASQRRIGKRKNATNIDDEFNANQVEAPTPVTKIGIPQHQSTAVKHRRIDEEDSVSESRSSADFLESSPQLESELSESGVDDKPSSQISLPSYGNIHRRSQQFRYDEESQSIDTLSSAVMFSEREDTIGFVL